MQEYAVPNMYAQYAQMKYAMYIWLYASIYKNMQNMHLYENIHMHIYAKSMQKYAKLNTQKYWSTCTKGIF